MAKIGDSNTDAEFNEVKSGKAPVDSDDVVRKTEHDGKADQSAVDDLGSSKADVSYVDSEVGTKAPIDGGGTATLDNYQAIDTEEVHTGRDISHSYDVRVISSNVADLGVAINDAIAEMAPDGGIIQLPKGRVPMSTQVDLSSGTNNQLDRTPLIIRGHGAGHWAGGSMSLGTQIDATGMASHGFFLGGPEVRVGIQLRDFAIEMGDISVDGFHLGEGSGMMRRMTLNNINCIGNARYGVWVSQAFGCSFTDLYCRNIEQGFRFEKCNASHFDGIVSRLMNHTTDAAIEFIDVVGYSASSIYAESNDGPGVTIGISDTEFSTTWGSAKISGIYTENNNRSGSAAHDVYINQDNCLVTGFVLGSPNTAFSGRQMRVQGRKNTITNGKVNQSFTSWRGYNTMQGVRAVELHSGGREPNMWMMCEATQTDDRNSSDWIIGDFGSDAWNKLPELNLTDTAGEGAGVGGEILWHDGTDGNSVNQSEPAAHDGTNWVGLISGNVID